MPLDDDSHEQQCPFCAGAVDIILAPRAAIRLRDIQVAIFEWVIANDRAVTFPHCRAVPGTADRDGPFEADLGVRLLV